MPLYGLEKTSPDSVRPRGGVAKVELIPAGSFAGMGEAGGVGGVGEVGSVPAAAGYAFREDRAHYSETRSGDGLQMLVHHSLVMEFPAGEAARRAADELVARSGEGFVAIVTTASGERLSAGWSERFGTGYPLRVAKVSSASGSVPADFPAITVTLESVDADFSKGWS